MALSAFRLVDTKQKDPLTGGIVIDYTVAASTTIYQGAFVTIDAGGDIIPCATGTATDCLGIAQETVDNSSGADGDLTCPVLVGAVIEHALTATVANIDDPVYASDDETLTLTAGTDSFVGQIIQLSAANTVLVQMGTFADE